MSGRLEKAGVVVTMLVGLAGIYDAWVKRRDERRREAKDERLQALETRMTAAEEFLHKKH